MTSGDDTDASGERFPVPEEGRSVVLAGFLVVAWIVLGAWLRVAGFDRQVVLDDEVHTIRAAVEHDAAYLVSHRHAAAYSIPLALYDRLLTKTVGLDEVGLRVPMLAAGLALLVGLPLVVGRWFGSVAAVAAAGLVAISPSLVLYSRFARPYGIVAGVAFLAWALAARFERSGSARAAVGAGFAGGCAVGLHPYAAPAVAGFLAPFVLLPGGAASWRARAVLALAGVSTAALWSAPSLSSLLATAQDKLGKASPGARSFVGALAVALGTASAPAVLGVLAAMIVGLVAGRAAGDRGRALSKVRLGAALAISGSAVAVVWTRPSGSSVPIVLFRYCIAALPAGIVLASAGMAVVARVAARSGGRGRTNGGRRTAAAPLVMLASSVGVALLAIAGPFPALLSGARNDFTNDRRAYQGDRPRPEAAEIPAFYRALRRTGHHVEGPARPTIVEAPWILSFTFQFYGDLQRFHGCPVVTASVDPWFGAPGVRLKTVRFVGGAEPLRLGDSELLVVHRDPMREVERYFGDPLPNDGLERERHRAAKLRRKAERIRERAGAGGCTIVYEDDDVVVYAGRREIGDAVRRRLEGAAPSEGAGAAPLCESGDDLR